MSRPDKVDYAAERRARLEEIRALRERITQRDGLTLEEMSQHGVETQRLMRAARARLDATDGPLGHAKVMAEDWMNGAWTVWANELERAARWFYWAGRDAMVRQAMERLEQVTAWAEEDNPGEERRYGRPLRYAVRQAEGGYVVVDEQAGGRVVCGPTRQRRHAAEAYRALNDMHQMAEGSS